MLRTLGRFIFGGGYNSSAPKLMTDIDVMSDGSENVYITGTGKTQVWKNILARATVIGSKVMINVGDTYAGLGRHDDSTALGSVFRVLGAIFFIGQGRLYYTGVDTSDSATTTLSLKKITSGSLGTIYQAGSAEPSAPLVQSIDAPSGFTGKNNGVVSVKISRLRASTGGESNASPTSAIVACVNQSVAVTFPSADSNGQDYWVVYGTKNGEGGVGLHLFQSEISEAAITATVTANATTDADTTIGVPNGTLTAAHIGWRYTSAGDTTTYVTDVGAADTHSSGKQTITLNAASVLSTTQSATFTRAVAGTIRTYVVEWRDSDLEAQAAPIRNFPPPAGVFAGSIEDVAFVDGCYGDTVDITTQTDALRATYSAANVGNAIAVSDPVKPESYPPDNYLFTGDAPTALLAGVNGMYWRFAQNSLGVIRYIGGSPALSYERIWSGVGVLKQGNACLGQGGRLYAFTAKRGLVRMGQDGHPDTQFASPVTDDMALWTPANVVLGFDGDHQLLCCMHNRQILAFYEPLGMWCAPFNIPAGTDAGYNIAGAVTVGGEIYISMTNGSNIKLYKLNAGTGTTGTVRTGWIPSSEVSDTLQKILIGMRADASGQDKNVTVKLYANGVATARAAHTTTLGVSRTGLQHLMIPATNLKGAKSWRIELSYPSDGGDAGFDLLEVQGRSSNLTW